MIAWTSVGKTDICPLGIGIKNQVFLEKSKVGILIPINWFNSCNDTFLAGMKLTLHKSQVHSYRVMQWWACSSLVSPPLPAETVAEVASGLFYCWSLLRNKHGNKSAKVHFVLRYPGFCCMRLLNAHILAANIARQWHADSGKPRTFILCEKKHEWDYSNASTSLKNPLLARVRPMCLSVKLHLCRLLFMQYKITWLVRIHPCKLVGKRLNRWGFVLTSEWTLSVKLYFAVSSFHNSSGKFCKTCVVF